MKGVDGCQGHCPSAPCQTWFIMIKCKVATYKQECHHMRIHDAPKLTHGITLGDNNSLVIMTLTSSVSLLKCSTVIMFVCPLDLKISSNIKNNVRMYLGILHGIPQSTLSHCSLSLLLFRELSIISLKSRWFYEILNTRAL